MTFTSEWGINDLEGPEPGGSRADLRAARHAEALYQQASDLFEDAPGRRVARAASYALAAGVHACSAGLAAAGIWLVVAVPSFVTVPMALILLLSAVELRPRLGSLRRLRPLRRRKDAPALFGVLDQVADAVGAPPVHAVAADATWGISYRTVGLRQRRIVTIGLPLWDTLPGEQKIAVLSHELAHAASWDAWHGIVVGTSIDTLDRMQEMLEAPRWEVLPKARRTGSPYSRSGPFWDPTQIGEMIARPFMAPTRWVVTAALTAQGTLSFRSRQQAEYLADVTAARVASPASAADALDTVVTGRATYQFVTERYAFDRKDSDFWRQLRAAREVITKEDRERRRRAVAARPPRVTDTHPPAHLRIAMLWALPPAEASLSLSAAQEDSIRQELAADYARIAREVDKAARLRQ